MFKEIVEMSVAMKAKRKLEYDRSMQEQDIIWIKAKIYDVADAIESSIPDAVEKSVDVRIFPDSYVKTRIRPNRGFYAWSSDNADGTDNNRHYYWIEEEYLVCVKRSEPAGSMMGVVDPETGDTYVRRDIYICRRCKNCGSVIDEKQIVEISDFGFESEVPESGVMVCSLCDRQDCINDIHANDTRKGIGWISKLSLKLKNLFHQTKH